MNLVLLHAPFPQRASPDGAIGERARLVLEECKRRARSVLVVTSERDFALPPEGISRLQLDPIRFDGRQTLEGILRESRADCVVCSGLLAALGVGQLETEVPIWIDLAEDPLAPLAADLKHVWADSEAAFWHRILWAVDRADHFTVAQASLRIAVQAMANLRGRHEDLGAPKVAVWSPQESLPEATSAWMDRPSRAVRGRRILGRPEIEDFTLASRTRAGDGRVTGPGRAERMARRRDSLGIGALTSKLTSRAFDAAFGSALSLSVPRPRTLSSAHEGHRADDAHLLGPDERARIRARLGRRPRLLIVMPYQTYPPNHGGATRLWNLLNHLAGEVDIYLLRFHQHGYSALEDAALRRICRHVEFHHWEPAVNTPIWSIRPPSTRLLASESAAEAIHTLIQCESIDVLQLEYAEMGRYRAAASGAPVVLVEYELAYRSLARRRGLGFDRSTEAGRHYGASRLDELRQLRHEIETARQVEEVQVMSEVDAAELARYLPDRRSLRIVPNGVDSKHFAEPEAHAERAGLLFVGNFENAPNLEGIEWFVEKVWPALRARRPRESLTIAGAGAPERLRALDGSLGIRFLGELPDLAPLYGEHRVLLVPIRAGSGTRLKVLEGLASGIMVVSTALGVEGLEVEPDRDFLLAGTPEEFVEQIARALDDDVLFGTVSAAARALVREKYAWERVAESALTSVYSQVERRLPVNSADALSGMSGRRERSATAEVSIVIVADDDLERLHATLTAVEHQATRRRVETVVVVSDERTGIAVGSWGSDLQVVRAGARGLPRGAMLDRGVDASSGELIVVLGASNVPSGSDWLDGLIEPLEASLAPGLVAGTFLGGGARSLCEGGSEADHASRGFVARSLVEAWLLRHDGVIFSSLHGAFRREIWSAQRFVAVERLGGLGWQRAVRWRGWTPVSRPQAKVSGSGADASRDYHGALREGRDWRLLGERYSVSAALRDVRTRLSEARILGREGERSHFAPATLPLFALVGNRSRTWNV